MEIKISEIIRSKRHEMNISQESLAEAFGITVQAVSKWETGLSYPDITVIPKIAEFFKISLNELFFGIAEEKAAVVDELPDDDRLRVVQCLGRRVLKKKEYKKDDSFKLVIPENNSVLNFEIWGSANIEGDISGNADIGGGTNCGNVGGCLNAGGGVNCGNIDGYANAGGGINCGNVNGNADAGGSVNCGDVTGSVDAGGNIKCGVIGGNADAGGDIECGDIKGDASAGEKITCKSIGGDAKCDKIIMNNRE